MLVTEIERDGQRAMPTTLSPNETYACDNHDLAALDFFGMPTAMRMFPAKNSCACSVRSEDIRAWRLGKRKRPGSRPKLIGHVCA